MTRRAIAVSKGVHGPSRGTLASSGAPESPTRAFWPNRGDLGLPEGNLDHRVRGLSEVYFGCYFRSTFYKHHSTKSILKIKRADITPTL